MTQTEYKYLAYCDVNHLEYTFTANSIYGLMDTIDDWYKDTMQGTTPYEAQVVDGTINISDFQFLVYQRHNDISLDFTNEKGDTFYIHPETGEEIFIKE
jgi:hypothetical protein